LIGATDFNWALGNAKDQSTKDQSTKDFFAGLIQAQK